MKRNYASKRSALTIILLVGGILMTFANASAETKSLMAVNSVNVNDYSPQMPFIDAMKSARPWATRPVPNPTYIWDSGVISQIPCDENGYPLEIPYNVGGENQNVHTLMFRGLGSHYPAGTYTVFYEGDGDLAFEFDAKGYSRVAPGKYEVSVTPGNDGIHLTITRSNPSDHVRNIRVVMPGFENTYEDEIFYPPFIERMGNLSTIRCMKLQHIDEGNPIVTWADRPTPTYYTQTTDKGLSLEYIIALANKTKKDIWVNIPHMADDDYALNFAIMLRDSVDPSVKIYIEYSNELWNGVVGFPQAFWVRDRGCELGIYNSCYDGINGDTGKSDPNDGSDKLWSGIYFQAKRSAEIFKIFDSVFSDQEDRIVKVLAGQAGLLYEGQKLLTAFSLASSNGVPINPAPQATADAFAIAPYFGGYLGTTSYEAQVSSMDLDALFQELNNNALPESIGWIQGYKQLSGQYGLELIGYEGGQHLAPVGTVANNSYIVNLFIAANRDARMKNLYDLYLDAWFANGGKLMCVFNYVFSPGTAGSWGILEYLDQPIETAYKYQAVMEAANKYIITSTTFGDIDSNGFIDAYDAALTARAAVGTYSFSDEQLQAADVDGSSDLTAYDAALIARKAVGLINNFPVET